MSKLLKLATRFAEAVPHLNPVIKVVDTGSVYVKLSGKVKQVRVSDHTGRKTSRNSWELRTDAMTTRKNMTRIYNANAFNLIIKDIK
jgi:hypothetical protein